MSTITHFARCVWIFFRERFPIWPAQILIVAQTGLGLVYLTHGTAQSAAPAAILERALIMPLLLLLIRIFDELKDFEADRLHFPDRPTARGLITRQDLTRLAVTALVLIGALTFLDLESKWMWIFLAASLTYAGLMRVWFFREEKIKSSLGLALLTHNPVSVPLALFQVSVLGNPAEWPLRAWFYAVSSVCFSFAWEVGRKIRRPADETAYVTYSKIWSPARAATAALVAMIAGFICLVLAGAPIPLLYAAAPALVVLGAAGTGLLFIWNPGRYRFPQTIVESGMVAGFLYILLAGFVH